VHVGEVLRLCGHECADGEHEDKRQRGTGSHGYHRAAISSSIRVVAEWSALVSCPDRDDRCPQAG
jgi:hypothetical protein